MSELKTPVSDKDHIQGSPDAPVTLLEYGDYECPHCAAAHPMVHQLQERFGDKLRFVFRNFPLNRIHLHAEAAAQTAEFAASRDKFWPMHDLLLENQPRLSHSVFADLATKLGLDAAELRKALQDGSFEGKVHLDFTGGVRSGVNGTPTFFLNGERYDGAKDFQSLAAAIEALA
jgi:protein-disulfide isomerase